MDFTGTSTETGASELKSNRAGKALLILMPALILPFVVLFQGDLHPIERDFAVLYVAGQTVLHTPETLFNVKSFTESTSALAAQFNANLVGTATLWLYPAVTAWLYAPLTMLPFHAAYWVITAASLLALSAISYLMAGFLSARDCRFLGLCMLASPAIVGTIIHGQTAIFSVLLITLAMCDKADTRRGLWVGLLALKPLFVLQMLGWLALKKQWRALGIAAGISLTLAIVSIVTTGIPGFLEHIALLRAVAAHSFRTAEINTQPTLSGLTMLLGIGWIGWAALAIPVVVLVAANRNNPNFDSIALLGAVLVAPYMHNTEAGMAMLLVVAGMVARGSGRMIPVGLILAVGWITKASLLIGVSLLLAGFFYVALREYSQREIVSA